MSSDTVETLMRMMSADRWTRMDTNITSGLANPYGGIAASQNVSRAQGTEAKVVNPSKSGQEGRLETRTLIKAESSDGKAEKSASPPTNETEKQTARGYFYNPDAGMIFKETHPKIEDIVYVQIPTERQIRAREEYSKALDAQEQKTPSTAKTA